VEVVSNFARVPCLDARGDLYFVHRYFDAVGKMIEADIYVACSSDMGRRACLAALLAGRGDPRQLPGHPLVFLQ
jgi:hypothetical protein